MHANFVINLPSNLLYVISVWTVHQWNHYFWAFLYIVHYEIKVSIYEIYDLKLDITLCTVQYLKFHENSG